jgi:hypothetical protein
MGPTALELLVSAVRRAPQEVIHGKGKTRMNRKRFGTELKQK